MICFYITDCYRQLDKVPFAMSNFPLREKEESYDTKEKLFILVLSRVKKFTNEMKILFTS